MANHAIEWLIAIAASIAACLVLVFAHLWRRATTDGVGRWFADENMPLVLRNAQLFMSEQDVSMSRPVALHGRVDQVFLARTGLLILVDTKTRDRHRVYGSDIWQLAVYAAILDITAQHPVSSYAFVRTVVRTETARSVRYHVVRLPSFQDTLAKAQGGAA